MLPTLADLNQSTFMPNSLEPTVHKLLNEPDPALTLIALRSLYYFLQEELDKFLDTDLANTQPAGDKRDGGDGASRTAAPGDNSDGGDGDSHITGARDKRDGGDGDSHITGARDKRDGGDGDSRTRAAGDKRDGDDGNWFDSVGPDGFFNIYPAGFDPGPELVVDEALLYRVYRARFYFTASAFLEHVRSDTVITGRDDIAARLTPSSVAHELKRLGLPYRRTNQRRLYNLTFPILIRLIELYGRHMLPHAAYGAAPGVWL